MKTTVKQRLNEYIKHKDISVRSFERACGLSYGYVHNMRVSIQPEKVESIARQYPDLNPGWLLTGEGNMLKYGSPEDAENSQVVIVPHKAKYKNIKSVKIYNANATMGIVALFDDNNDNGNVIGELSVPFLPYSDGAVVATGNSMYPLIQPGAVVAFRKINSLDSILSGEIYLIEFIHEGDRSTVIKYIQVLNDDESSIKLSSYHKEHGNKIIPKSEITFLALVTAWVNFSSM